MSGYDNVTINAFIAIIVSAIGSILSYFLSTKKSEKDAKRDYHYAAKRKLYDNYEPLVFQFHQLCENAYDRIGDLAEHLRKGGGKLEEREEKGSEKYARNTAYRIVAPLAVFKLMEQRLTEFDINLDYKIRSEYLFAKALFNLLRNDRLRKRGSIDEVDSSQAVHSSDLDRMCEALIDDKSKASTTATIKSIGQFSDLQERDKIFAPIVDLLIDIFPDNKELFWRNLLGYAYICRAIGFIEKTPEEIRYRLFQGYFRVPADEFYWHNGKSTGKNKAKQKAKKHMFNVINESFEQAREHLKLTFKGRFDDY